MTKYIKILIVLLVIVGAVYLARDWFSPKGPTDEDLEAMKQSIITDPVIGVDDLTEEQEQMFLSRFEDAKSQVLEFNFDILQGINDVAIIKKALGDIEGAKIAWEYANIIRPQNSLSFANLGALYHYDLREFDKAEENYLTAITNDPDDIPTIRNLWELYFYDFKDNAKAEALLLAAIEQNPESADLYSLSGSFYQNIGEKEKAIEMYERHLQLNPDNEAVMRELEKLKQTS